VADVAEEDQVITPYSSLFVAASLGAATILIERKNERTQHGLNDTSESENHLERTMPFCRTWPQTQNK